MLTLRIRWAHAGPAHPPWWLRRANAATPEKSPPIRISKLLCYKSELPYVSVVSRDRQQLYNWSGGSAVHPIIRCAPRRGHRTIGTPTPRKTGLLGGRRCTKVSTLRRLWCSTGHRLGTDAVPSLYHPGRVLYATQIIPTLLTARARSFEKAARLSEVGASLSTDGRPHCNVENWGSLDLKQRFSFFRGGGWPWPPSTRRSRL